MAAKPGLGDYAAMGKVEEMSASGLHTRACLPAHTRMLTCTHMHAYLRTPMLICIHMHAYLHTHVPHTHIENGKRIKYRVIWGPVGKDIDAAHIGCHGCGRAEECGPMCKGMIFG